MTTLHPLVMILFAIITATGSGCTGASSEGKDPQPSSQAEPTGEATQALTGVQKICSAVSPDNWRDTIEVGDGWTNLACRGWAQSVGAPTWQVGCFFDSGFSWGAASGGLPNPNCGWTPACTPCPTGGCVTPPHTCPPPDNR